MSFQDLLSKSVDSVERPAPLPEGTYEVLIKAHNFGESDRKKTPYCEFEYQLMATGLDVDKERLDSALKGKPLSERSIRDSFYITEKALPRLREFLERAGVNIVGRPFTQCIPEAIGRRVLIFVKQEAGEGDVIYNNASKYAALE